MFFNRDDRPNHWIVADVRYAIGLCDRYMEEAALANQGMVARTCMSELEEMKRGLTEVRDELDVVVYDSLMNDLNTTLDRLLRFRTDILRADIEGIYEYTKNNMANC